MFRWCKSFKIQTAKFKSEVSMYVKIKCWSIFKQSAEQQILCSRLVLTCLLFVIVIIYLQHIVTKIRISRKVLVFFLFKNFEFYSVIMSIQCHCWNLSFVQSSKSTPSFMFHSYLYLFQKDLEWSHNSCQTVIIMPKIHILEVVIFHLEKPKWSHYRHSLKLDEIIQKKIQCK